MTPLYLGYTIEKNAGLAITITGPVASPPGSGAGQIQLDIPGPGKGGYLDAWCVDLYDGLLDSGTFNVLDSSGLNGAPGVPTLPPLSTEQIGAIGALKLNGDDLLAHKPSNAADIGAAIQIAIWTVEYGSAFTYDPLGSPVDGTGGLVAQYLNDVGPGGTWSPFTNYYVLEATGNQTLIVDTLTPTPHSIPEPSTWAMMLLGFTGLGYAAFRRKAKGGSAAAA